MRLKQLKYLFFPSFTGHHDSQLFTFRSSNDANKRLNLEHYFGTCHLSIWFHISECWVGLFDSQYLRVWYKYDIDEFPRSLAWGQLLMPSAWFGWFTLMYTYGMIWSTLPDVLQCIILHLVFKKQQGKSEGFESCDRPIVQKRPIWVKIGDVLYRVTLKFDGWPWKTIGHLSFAVSSFVQHLIAIGEFKLVLQSGNAQFGSNSTIFRAVWPWNLTYDLEKQSGKAQFGSNSTIFRAVWPWNLTDDLEKQ